MLRKNIKGDSVPKENQVSFHPRSFRFGLLVGLLIGGGAGGAIGALLSKYSINITPKQKNEDKDKVNAEDPARESRRKEFSDNLAEALNLLLADNLTRDKVADAQGIVKNILTKSADIMLPEEQAETAILDQSIDAYLAAYDSALSQTSNQKHNEALDDGQAKIQEIINSSKLPANNLTAQVLEKLKAALKQNKKTPSAPPVPAPAVPARPRPVTPSTPVRPQPAVQVKDFNTVLKEFNARNYDHRLATANIYDGDTQKATRCKNEIDDLTGYLSRYNTDQEKIDALKDLETRIIEIITPKTPKEHTYE